MDAVRESPASLESLVETGMLEVESLHPGGLDLTRELAELCGIHRGARVLDIASGTGETACFLAETFGALVHGVDHSEQMVNRAREKAKAKGLAVEFSEADADRLPFGSGEFDIAICECTLCFLDKEATLREMARVVRPGGRVGMHDLCWREDTSDDLKKALAELEDEKPETLDGWRHLFVQAGLVRVDTLDKSALKSQWMRESRRQVGPLGQMSLMFKIVRRWGFGGLWRILRSQRVFADERLGYGIVVGTKQ